MLLFSSAKNRGQRFLVLASFLREPLEMIETFVLCSDSIQRVKKYVWKYIMRMIYNYLCDKFLILNWQSKGGALPPANVARMPYVGWVCCWLALLLWEERFFSGYAVFSTPQKPTFRNSSSIRNQVDEERLCGFANCKSLFISIYSSSYFTRLGGDNQRNVNQR